MFCKGSWKETARNIVYNKNVIECELRSMDGKWIYNKLEFFPECEYHNINGRFQWVFDNSILFLIINMKKNSERWEFMEKKFQSISKKHNILVIVDEVMSGFGRTGKMFAYEHYNGTPDMITIAKGLTNGSVPMGAVILSDTLSKDYREEPVNNGLTYSGHPLACASANACLDLYNQNLMEQVQKNGDTIRSYLNYLVVNYPQLIKEYRGVGQLYCIEFYDDNISYIQKALLVKGIYTFFKGNNLFIAPPLIISDAELVRTLETFDEICLFAHSHV